MKEEYRNTGKSKENEEKEKDNKTQMRHTSIEISSKYMDHLWQ